jgi:hypothetical protein
MIGASVARHRGVAWVQHQTRPVAYLEMQHRGVAWVQHQGAPLMLRGCNIRLRCVGATIYRYLLTRENYMERAAGARPARKAPPTPGKPASTKSAIAPSGASPPRHDGQSLDLMVDDHFRTDRDPLCSDIRASEHPSALRQRATCCLAMPDSSSARSTGIVPESATILPCPARR